MSIIYITEDYLKYNPNHIFVYGDNTLHYGTAGAAKLRYMPNTYGFITKIKPDNKDDSFYRPSDYRKVYIDELNKLIGEILAHQDKTYLISKLGSGLANKYGIFESIIEPDIKNSLNQENVKFLW